MVAAIIFYYITSCIIPGTPFSWTTALGNLFNLQGISCKSLVSPFWSLSYEVWFYIILGALAFLVNARTDRSKSIALIFFVATSSVFVLGLEMHYLLIWLMGALAFLYKPRQKNKLVLWLSLLGFLICVVYWQLSKDTRSLEMAIEGTNNELLELVMSLMACLFIQQVILFEPRKRFVRNIEKNIGGLAKFSYTLYLSHRIVFLWIVAYIWSKDSCQFTTIGVFRYMAILLITLVSCWLLYLVSERFSPQIKKYLKTLLLK